MWNMGFVDAYTDGSWNGYSVSPATTSQPKTKTPVSVTPPEARYTSVTRANEILLGAEQVEQAESAVPAFAVKSKKRRRAVKSKKRCHHRLRKSMWSKKAVTFAYSPPVQPPIMTTPTPSYDPSHEDA